jgi:hypothetical protein
VRSSTAVVVLSELAVRNAMRGGENTPEEVARNRQIVHTERLDVATT